jgi:hypothetical protein
MIDRTRSLRFDFDLSDGQRRICALLFLAIPVLLTGAFLWSFVSGAVAHRQRVAALEQEARAYDQLAKELPLRQAEISKLIASPDLALLFPPLSATVATKRVEQAIGSIVQVAGANMGDSNVEVRLSPDSPLLEVEEHAAITCNIAVLTKVLYALEHSRPGLFVNRITIEPKDVDGAIGTSNNGPRLLQADMIISAYLRQS